MEGGEESETVAGAGGIWNRSSSDHVFDELYEAEAFSETISGRIQDLVNNNGLLKLESDMLNFHEKFGCLGDYFVENDGGAKAPPLCLGDFNRKKFPEVDEMETGEGSTGRSGGEFLQQHKSSTSEIKPETPPLPAVSPPMPMAVGGSMGSFPLGYHGPVQGLSAPGFDREELLHHDTTVETHDRIIGKSEEIPEETIQRLIGAIILKFEAEGCDLSPILEAEKTIEAEETLKAEKTRKDVEVALRFGFNLQLLGKHIDELRHELWGIVSSFSPENRDVLRSMNMLAREPCLHGVAKFLWISQQISMLQRMDLDLDSEVKSTMLKLKSESYLSSLKKEERSGGEGVAGDKTTFAAYRLSWERTWGNGFSFEDQTLLSPMQFTHCHPSRVPVDAVAGSTLQIYSIKVSAKGNVWPLNVYGVVTARDSVDRQRNPLFIRTRNYCQVLTKEDPFLHLTGPVRAIVSMDTVYIETELKAKKGRSKSIVLASTVINSYSGDGFTTSLADNKHCTIELCFEKLEHSVQATIVSVVVKSKPGSLPWPYGGKIMYRSLPCSDSAKDFASLPPSRQAVVFDSADGELINERAGHLDLSRRVVSVELEGQLQIYIQPYSQSDSAAIDTQVLLFTPSRWGITEEARCLDDGSEVMVTIAWSLIPSKMLS